MTPPGGASEDQFALANPVFQNGIARTLDDASAELLLVGQSGKRHFSAVVRLSANSIWIDVADRWSAPLPITRVSLDFQWHGLIALGGREAETGSEPESLEFRAADSSPAGCWTVRPHGGSSAAPLLLALSQDSSTQQLIASKPITDAVLSPRTISYGLEFAWR